MKINYSFVKVERVRLSQLLQQCLIPPRKPINFASTSLSQRWLSEVEATGTLINN
jgi:hypothetical protein